MCLAVSCHSESIQAASFSGTTFPLAFASQQLEPCNATLSTAEVFSYAPSWVRCALCAGRCSEYTCSLLHW